MEKSKSESKPERHIANPYGNAEIGIKYGEMKESLKIHLDLILQELEEKYPACSNVEITSCGKENNNFTIYTGCGGNIYLYERLYILYKEYEEEYGEERIESAKKNAEIALEVGKEEIKTQVPGKDIASFFLGAPGILTLGCVIHHRSGDIERRDKCFKELEKFVDSCTATNAQDELLFGNAGYLYSLLFIANQLPDLYPTLNHLVLNVVKLLLDTGQTKDGDLKYSFPRAKNNLFLGAAHGTVGVLYMLILATKLFPHLSTSLPHLLPAIAASMKVLLSQQLESGNFSYYYEKKEDVAVHFCHGAAGVVALFIEAFQMFQTEPEYLSAAIYAGECIWKRGIIKKGNGLCHGIAGNAYAFLQWTEDVKWKERAFCFAISTWEESIQCQVREFIDPQRKVKGIPDSPFSLMEGMAGTAIFYIDLLILMMKAKEVKTPLHTMFPGFEI